jgi:PBP1b-binding outer membrane lipoprotein LpoB
MKELIIVGPVLLVIALMLSSCASQKPAETTSAPATTHETTVEQPSTTHEATTAIARAPSHY